MDGYLLDTNALSAYFNGHQQFLGRMAALDARSHLFASAISLGEVFFGNERTQSTNEHRRDEWERWIRNEFHSNLIGITKHTSIKYGQLKARVLSKYSPRSPGDDNVSMCMDHDTGVILGIHENDLWIAAQAITHNLILLSNDSDMQRIKEAFGPELDVDDWERP